MADDENTGDAKTPSGDSNAENSPPPRPKTTEHKPNVTYFTKSYEGGKNDIKRDKK